MQYFEFEKHIADGYMFIGAEAPTPKDAQEQAKICSERAFRSLDPIMVTIYNRFLAFHCDVLSRGHYLRVTPMHMMDPQCRRSVLKPRSTSRHAPEYCISNVLRCEPTAAERERSLRKVSEAGHDKAMAALDAATRPAPIPHPPVAAPPYSYATAGWEEAALDCVLTPLGRCGLNWRSWPGTTANAPSGLVQTQLSGSRTIPLNAHCWHWEGVHTHRRPPSPPRTRLCEGGHAIGAHRLSGCEAYPTLHCPRTRATIANSSSVLVIWGAVHNGRLNK